jgi:hypothetical protein
MNKKTTILVVIVVLLIIILVVWKSHTSNTVITPIQNVTTETTTGTTQSSINTQQDSTSYAGTISITTSGQLVYVSDKENLKLMVPKGWHIGSNDLGYGTLQFFNYDETQASGKSEFPKGDNKIEAVVTTDTVMAGTSDYPQTASTTKQVVIAGQHAEQINITLAGGDKMRAFIIPLSSNPSQFLRIVIYGDPFNFSVLDQVAQSIRWMK